jgi:hypothetical protein
MEFILFLVGLYLINKLGISFYSYYQILSNRYRQRQLRQKLIANHPEMKGVQLDQSDLLFFGADKEFRSLVMNNDEPSDNTAIEDSEKFAIVVDEYDDDDDE